MLGSGQTPGTGEVSGACPSVFPLAGNDLKRQQKFKDLTKFIFRVGEMHVVNGVMLGQGKFRERDSMMRILICI